MIKKATREQVIDSIDSERYVNRLKAMADGPSETQSYNATVKLLEITGIITKDSKKVSAEGTNVRLVIED